MRKAILYTVLLFEIVLMNGCKRSCYLHEEKECNYVNQMRDTLDTELLDYRPLGATGMLTFNNYIFFITDDPSGQLRVYDIEKEKEIASLCLPGRSINDFISPRLVPDQIYMRNGEIILPLIDNFTILKEVNVTQSLKQNSTVVESHIPCVNPKDGYFALIDNSLKKTFVYNRPVMENGGCTTPVCKIEEEGETTIIPVFDQLIDGEDNLTSFAQYMGAIKKHPQKNLIVQALQYMNYILFYDLDNNNYFAIHQKGTRSFDDRVVSGVNYNPQTIYFGDVAVADDFFFATYWANCRNNPDTDIKSEVLKFDWNGNYLGGFVLTTLIHRFSYNEKNKTLYGLDLEDDKVYKICFKDELLK